MLNTLMWFNSDDDHGHGHHAPYEEPKTFADYVKPEYWYR